MAIRHGMESAYIQERRKWETLPVMIDSQWVQPTIVDGARRPGYQDGTYVAPLPRSEGGKFPYEHQEYPKMLYRAGRPTDMNVEITANTIADNESHERQLKGMGWSVTQEAAIQAVHDQDQELAKLAANRAFHDRHMSEKAQGEALAAERVSSQHLGEIPAKPKRKYVKKATVSA